LEQRNEVGDDSEKWMLESLKNLSSGSKMMGKKVIEKVVVED
jgi:hypothetical protein